MKLKNYSIFVFLFLMAACSSKQEAYVYPEFTGSAFLNGISTSSGIALPIAVDGQEITANAMFFNVPSVVTNPVPVTPGIHNVTYIFLKGDKGVKEDYTLNAQADKTYFPEFDTAQSRNGDYMVNMWLINAEGDVVSQKNKLTLKNIK